MVKWKKHLLLLWLCFCVFVVFFRAFATQATLVEHVRKHQDMP